MLNFRYHIVSLVAVFLALGVGILMGTTVIDQGLVARLKSQTFGLEGRLASLQAKNDDLGRRTGLWDSYGRTSLMPLMKGRLKSRSIVLFQQDGADTKVTDAIAQAMIDAGATVGGRITSTSRWTLKDDAARQSLATALGVEPSGADTLLGIAAEDIGRRLAVPADPSSAGDLLGGLRDAGYLSIERPGTGAFPAPGTTFILIPSGVRDAKPAQDRFFVPLLRSISTAGRPVVVAEPLSSAESLADRIRSDADLRAKIATVDDADVVLGRVALIAAIRSQGAGLGAQHFGARRSAAALIPPLP